MGRNELVPLRNRKEQRKGLRVAAFLFLLRKEETWFFCFFGLDAKKEVNRLL